MRRLLPDPAETTVSEQLDAYRPWEEAPSDRPHVAGCFAATVDGAAAIEGRSGKIGSAVDTAMLVGLRTRVDAVLIGAGTMRAERYGRVVGDPERRAARERSGLAADAPLVILSSGLDLPWDAPVFEEEGEVVIFTSSDAEPPAVTPRLEVVRQSADDDAGSALRHLRAEHGVRAVLCEGGPGLHAELWAAGLVDELFLTIAPKLAGKEPTILEGELPGVVELELAWLLEEEGELFGRYRRRR